MARMMMHMRVRKVVVVGSHGQRDDHGGDRGGKTDTYQKSLSFPHTPKNHQNTTS